MTHEEVANAVESILAGSGTGLDVGEPRQMNGLVCIPILINGERFLLTVDSAEESIFATCADCVTETNCNREGICGRLPLGRRP